jgi:hypothetical protein
MGVRDQKSEIQLRVHGQQTAAATVGSVGASARSQRRPPIQNGVVNSISSLD